MILAYLLLILPLIFGYKYFLFKLKFRDIDKFPGPKCIPILGNGFEFGGNSVDFLRNMIRLIKEFGPIFRVWINPTVPTLMISDVKYVEEILSSSIHIEKGQSYDTFKLWLGNGLFTTDAQSWPMKRKMLRPTMHYTVLESFLPTFTSQSEVLVQKLKTAIRKEETLDIYPYVKLFALDNICETSVGVSINAQRNPNLEYIKAVAGFLNCLMIRIFSVYMQSDFLYRFTKNYTEQQKHLATITSFTKNVIKQKKRSRKSNKTEVQNEESDLGLKRKIDFLELLLDMEEAQALNEEEVREEVDTFMFGGHDTLSSALAFTLFSLSKYPKIQQDVLEEIKAEYDGTISTNFLKKLQLTERVIKESMRFYPTVPFIERKLTQDIKFNGLTVPANTCIAIIIYGLHYNEDNFPEAEKFDPDRFLPENCIKRNPYAYIPFSAGPRNCVGQKYTWFLLKVCIVKILTNFEILPVSGFEPILKNEATLKSVNGIYVTLKERK